MYFELVIEYVVSVEDEDLSSVIFVRFSCILKQINSPVQTFGGIRLFPIICA
jgi:hypothetical protein